MSSALRKRLAIDDTRLDELNAFLTDPDNGLVSDLLAVVERYGGPKEINRRAREAGKLENLMARLRDRGSPHVTDLDWLIRKRDAGEFITVEDYRREVLGDRADGMEFDEGSAVTLEISSCHYFSCLMAEARQALANGELMPGRFIRVRRMREQEEDGDLLAVTAAMRIMGSSWCETLDTKGTDGSNVHLGGPATITGYFGGVGQPNDHPVRWVDELLYYYTNYGTREVLNINPGTVLLGYLLHRLGIDIQFKISVFMGNDNPYAVAWTLMLARLFSREDGSTSLIGFNFSNSVDNATIEASDHVRRALGLEDKVRFEHHILETQKSIVIQPYDRRSELLELAMRVRNISAKHEGGEVDIDSGRKHPSDILDYFIPRSDVEAQGMMPALERNYLDKHDAINNTARALTENGLSFIAAPLLHHRR